MVTTRPPKTIVEPTALGTVANTDTKSLIYGLFQKGRVLAQDAISRAKQKDGFVSEIVLTHFSDKATIICKKGLVPGSPSQLKCNFHAIRELRNDIAHANYYAETPKTALNVCAVVRTILQINEDMHVSS